MIDETMLKKGEIDIDFFGDFRNLVEFNKEAMSDYINRFIDKYGRRVAIYDISVYIRKFEASYIGKPLIFCNIAANTEFGLVSSTGTGWGLNQAIRQALKTTLAEVHKSLEKEIYSRKIEVVDELTV